MAPRPTTERPPKGLNAYWVGAWRAALKVMQVQGTWAPELKPLLDEYIFALRAAEATRDGFAWLDHLEEAVASDEIDWLVLRQIAAGLPAQWDRHTKRAAALADVLVLTPKSRRALGLGSDDEDSQQDPLDALDGQARDELAPLRKRRAS